MSERESASERVLCVLGIKLMFQPLWLALVALQYYIRTVNKASDWLIANLGTLNLLIKTTIFQLFVWQEPLRQAW